MFHFWMFLHGIFALLATRGGESLTGFTNAAEEHHKSLEVSITNHPSIAKIRCDDASSEDNKMVYMNLVAPADSIGKPIIFLYAFHNTSDLQYSMCPSPVHLQDNYRYRSRSC